ncbi:hypothetical protein EDI_056790 [Entamoeba dispar SAW760]|uniref:Uncharacterized protein n=1 Tax=Entamoeba dispar (strain ATCC PRA-260 / SAW760) TaxID=370354 RepID=B0EMF9_ENTDS|nr:uncharacterized protein EDI_056790 [Entamoeba dispar SAW760]EDR24282.1 hypothetical protein EDI_056790 [Entamoeba dispar SAW760]|eukprot:EDR24282.1 hypothetical protein EDI_056790 [Entamoeba dispar SAW760]
MSDQEKDDSYTLTDEETNNEFTSVENSPPSKSHYSKETLKFEQKENTMEITQEQQIFPRNDPLTTLSIQSTTNILNEPEKKINNQTKKKNQSHQQEKSFTNKNNNPKINEIKDVFNQQNTKEQSDYSSSVELLQLPVAFPKKDDKIRIGLKSEKEKKILQKDLSSTTTFPKQRNQKETIGLLQPPLPIQTTSSIQKSNSSQKRTFQHIVRDIIKERESCHTPSPVKYESIRDRTKDIPREQQKISLNQNLKPYKKEEIPNVYPQQSLQPSGPKRISTFNNSFPSIVQQPEMFYRQEPLQIKRTIQQPQIGQQPILFNQNVFEVFEKYFMMFGAFVECWPDDAFIQYPKQFVKKVVKDYIMNPELFQTCPLHIRNQIYSYTALKYVLNQVRKGSYELPFELELMYKDGWERSCDVCLLKEMERCGLCYFEGYVQNDCINYVLTQVMKLSQEQKIAFIQQRCSFLLRCIILKR